MKIHPASPVRQNNGTFLPRKMFPKACAVCGVEFMGRKELKACGVECEKRLRSISAKNRAMNPLANANGLR
jgi:hypothetical protein